MAENLKALIEKIKQEGIQAAEEKARDIQENAKREAEKIIGNAKLEAKKIISQAEDESKKLAQTTNASLKQAGRDLILSLRKEINHMLDKIIENAAEETLDPEELTKIISNLIKGFESKGGSDIEIHLSSKDLEKLEKNFIGQLKKEAQKGITLKPSEEIIGGFRISYDAGKSFYDFTDKALAEYIGKYLKPKLDRILEISP